MHPGLKSKCEAVRKPLVHHLTVHIRRLLRSLSLTTFATDLVNFSYATVCSHGYSFIHSAADFSCLDTHNASNPVYDASSTDERGVKGVSRQWEWMLCNEPLGWWQTYVVAFPTGLLPYRFVPFCITMATVLSEGTFICERRNSCRFSKVAQEVSESAINSVSH